MKNTTLWIGSLLFIIGALMLHITALRTASNGAAAMRRIVSAKVSHKQKAQAEASGFSNRSEAFGVISTFAAALSIACLFFSRVKNERAPRNILYLLLVVYAVLQFVVV